LHPVYRHFRYQLKLNDRHLLSAYNADAQLHRLFSSAGFILFQIDFGNYAKHSATIEFEIAGIN
jgi:hypothetical protein